MNKIEDVEVDALITVVSGDIRDVEEKVGSICTLSVVIYADFNLGFERHPYKTTDLRFSSGGLHIDTAERLCK